MNRQFLDPKWRRSLLIKVRKGMPVYERDGSLLGFVDKVYLGRMATESIPVAEDNQEFVEEGDLPKDVDFYEDFAETSFPIDETEEKLRDEMMRRGFFLIKGDGLEGTAQIVLPGDIYILDDTGIRLKINRETLVDR